jgi:hypothetical protein
MGGMGLPVRISAVASTAVVAATLLSPVAASAAANAQYSAPLRTAVADLDVTTESRTGYQREKFPHWIDADHDQCNTRYEILIAEATTEPTVSDGCRLSGGGWYSYFDDEEWTNPADLDIDHFVPLAEAWDSGARDWTNARRQLFANDLDDGRTLAAVTDNVNQSKGDKDVAEWLPPVSDVRCRYIGEWVAVKTRWRLSVDQAEKDALTSNAQSCDNVTITVTYGW